MVWLVVVKRIVLSTEQGPTTVASSNHSHDIPRRSQ
jgi:hypothetical protein